MEATSGIDGILDLPGGGGAVGGLGDRFQPDLLKGSGNFAITLTAPRGPNDLKPQLALRYSSGNGNGPLGLGWQLTGPLQIRRRTDRGVPTYRDDQDEFELGGAEMLVSVGGGRYRPRADTQFWDIRRRGAGWEIRTKDGRSHLLGTDATARVADTAGRVLAWLEQEEKDSAGNAITFAYEFDGPQAYLTAVTWSLYAFAFRYEARPDSVHDGRGGFPVTMTRRMVAVERRCASLPQPLLARYDLAYVEAEGTRTSLLSQVRLVGIDDQGRTEAYPPLKLGYSRFAPLAARYTKVEAADPPPPLARAGVAFVDMNGDGLPDILSCSDSFHRWWPNRGDGSFGVARTIAQVPSGMVIGRQGVTFADLRGDGSADMLRIDARLVATVENTGRGGWARPQISRQQPALALSDVTTRLVDLDGDGISDLLQSTPDGFLLTYADGKGGWSRPQAVARRSGDGDQPMVSLDMQGVELADMTGDGLDDLVFVASGRVEYWPHFGRGAWGKRTRMRNPPALPSGFDRRRLFVIDVDGNGLADLVYVDANAIRLWLNQSGEAWSGAYILPFPSPPSGHSIQICDFLGNGLPGVLWSAEDRRGGTSGYRYLDIGGGKPFLLTSIDNGFGGITEIHYASSAAMRAEDERLGRPWETYLPFPVHVVASTRYTDRLTGRTAVTRTRYRDGVYDGLEREFRGFGQVDVETEPDLAMPGTLQISRFDVGNFSGPVDAAAAAPQERARRRALAGSLVGVETYEVASDGTRLPIQSATMEWDARLEFSADGRSVHFPRMVKMEARDHAPGDPDRVDAAAYEHDPYGNISRKRRTGFFASDASPPLVTDQTIAYTTNVTNWLVGLPAILMTFDGAGRLINETRHFYDGPAFTGLSSGEAVRGLLTRTSELALVGDHLPADYASHIRADWGFVKEGDRWYRTALAYARDAAGNIIAQRDGLGAEKSIAYDADQVFPTQRIDSLGHTTSVSFDRRSGQPAEVRLSDGVVTRYGYSPTGRLAAQWDTAGDGSLQLSQLFDVDFGDYSVEPPRPSHALSLRILAPGKTPQDFSDLKNLETLRDADPLLDYYDSEGNLVQRVGRAPRSLEDGPGQRWIVRQRRKWANAKRPLADYPNAFAARPEYDPTLDATVAVRFRYTGAGRLAEVTQADGGRIRFEYGASVRRRWMPHMANIDTPILERHDAWGRLVEVREPDGSGASLTTSYALDEADRPLLINDASGRVAARYTYAGPGPAVHIAHADAGERSYWYDASGRLRARSDSLARRIEFDYDSEGRMVSAADASGQGAPALIRTLTYQGSRLSVVTNPEVKETFEYDAAGRVIATTVDAGEHPLTTRQEFGPAGQLAAVIMPDGTRLAYRYDETLDVTAVDGFVDHIDYDAHGSVDRVVFVGGVAATYRRDPQMRRLQSAALAAAGASLRGIALTYDLAGRVMTWTDTSDQFTLWRSFEYDAANRLLRATSRQADAAGPILRDDRYAYSPSGDLLRNEESLRGAMLYGDASRTGLLTQVQGQDGTIRELTYDQAGCVRSVGGLREITYDLWDRLIGATLANGDRVTFLYDHAGQRVRKTIKNAATASVTHYAGKLFESDAECTRVSIYAGLLLVGYQVSKPGTDPQKICVLTDHLGSVLATCSQSGSILGQQIYSPYGRSLRGNTQDDGFTGVRADHEFDFAQFGSRYYAPEFGRFLAPDWWIIENPQRAMPFPQSLNAFSYAVGNPLIFRDPTGRWFGLDDLIVAAVGFVVGFIAGTIYGLATGQGWSSLLVGLEAGLCGAAGAWLAWNTAGAALGLMGVSTGGGVGGAIAIGAAVAGGFNGVVSGMTQIYDWTSAVGWLSFLSDSTWGLLGTSLGDLLITANLFYGKSARYNNDLSRRQNRHVYDGGFGFGNFAFTQGNVTSNLQNRGGGSLVNHETLHITQNRIFGPLFTGSYIAWFLGGAVVGGIIGIFVHQKWTQSVEDVAYDDNPWETWAYDVGGEAGGGKLSWS